MGKRGPAPTPTELLRARGSWRANERHGEPEPEHGRPGQPAGLSTLEASVWEQTCAALEAMGLLYTADAVALERYVRLLTQWRQAMDDVRTRGQMVDGKPNPYVKLALSWEGAVRHLEARFGLTPSDRVGLVATKTKGGAADNPFEPLSGRKPKVS